MQSTQRRAAVRQAAIRHAWHKGWLHYLLDVDQREQSQMLWSKQEDFVACLSRRRGKSYWACVEAVSFAIRNPKSYIKYVSKTQQSILDIIDPIMAKILQDCPAELQPTYDKQRHIWRWPSPINSEMKCTGTDNKHYENARGSEMHFGVKDESGFFDDYEAVDAVLSPQLLTTGGIILEISTPPETPAHPFTARYFAAQARGRAIHRTIYGNPRMTVEQIESFLDREAAKRGMTIEEFKASTYCKREFFAEFVTEESRAAIPGWTQERAATQVKEVRRPELFDAYCSLDLGFGDPHFALYAWWDFPRQTLVIEDEVTLKNANTEKLSDAMKATETALYGNTKFVGTLRGAEDFKDELPDWLRSAIDKNAPKQPYIRIADNNLLALADMHQKHGLALIPTRKDEKHLAVDEVDIMVRKGQIEINPKCVNLIKQLYGTLWNKQRTDWERNADGHGDAIDALVYMVRNINRHKDPRPKPVDQWGINQKPSAGEALARAFQRTRLK